MGPSSARNFAFLERHDPWLAAIATRAEQALGNDPAETLTALSGFAAALVEQLAALTGRFTDPDEDAWPRLQRLRRDGVLPPQAAELLTGLHRAGLGVDPKGPGVSGHARHQLAMAHQVAIWFHRAQGVEDSFEPAAYIAPTVDSQGVDAATGSPASTPGPERVLRLEQLQAHAKAHPREVERGILRGRAADGKIGLTEAQTRLLIDQQLRDAGWEVDTERLTFDRGTRPVKGRNLAISEWPTEDGGWADYVLFCGRHCVGVVEAKRHSKDVPSTLQQAKRYARTMVLHDAGEFEGGPWGEYRVPFLFATNGRGYLEQLETKSGIWFWDTRQEQPSVALPGWHSPADLLERLKVDPAAAHEKLQHEPMEFLGREYQHEAVHAVEAAVEKNARRILLAMATGTGKTRTALALVYRFLKTKRFRRVLFLVDRTNLGEQAYDAFANVKLERFQTIDKIYDVKKLSDLEPDTDTKLHFATVQSMMRRILYPSSPDRIPTVGQYDCVIVDECHRGYNLDREPADSELSFRDEVDYVSKYRQVLEYFDATVIGLTATPAEHTTSIFGRPVYTYGYRDAVVDGYLVDHEPPIRIVTEQVEDGIRFKANEKVRRYDPTTGTTDTATMPDEVHLEVDTFHRKVITPGFTKTACKALAEQIDPSLEGKTLVFCVNRDHAQDVVKELKDAFADKYGSVHDDAVVQITGGVDRPRRQILLFRNEQQPSVVVTVDLLTTGVDVPKICNLVFLRRVRSRILYEQMLGRATRRCDEIDKEYFRVYDCVALYSVLEPVNTMKPVVGNPRQTLQQLVAELRREREGEGKRARLRDQIVAKFRVKLRGLSLAAREEFVTLAEAEPEALAASLRRMTPAEVLDYFEAHPAVLQQLDRRKRVRAKQLIADAPDQVRWVDRDYGGEGGAAAYLQRFGEFVRGKEAESEVLQVVARRPRELTRSQYKELDRTLAEAGFTKDRLRTAVEETTGEELSASLVDHVRHHVHGTPLRPHAERVESALRKVLREGKFKDPQRRWLRRIAKQIEVEVVVDRAALDRGEFKAQTGGFARLDKRFDGQLDRLLGDLREAVWDDVG